MNHNDHVIVQFEKEISSSFSLKLFSTTASERKQLLKYAYLQVAQQMQNFKLKISGNSLYYVTKQPHYSV